MGVPSADDARKAVAGARGDLGEIGAALSVVEGFLTSVPTVPPVVVPPPPTRALVDAFGAYPGYGGAAGGIATIEAAVRSKVQFVVQFLARGDAFDDNVWGYCSSLGTKYDAQWTPERVGGRTMVWSIPFNTAEGMTAAQVAAGAADAAHRDAAKRLPKGICRVGWEFDLEAAAGFPERYFSSPKDWAAAYVRVGSIYRAAGHEICLNGVSGFFGNAAWQAALASAEVMALTTLFGLDVYPRAPLPTAAEKLAEIKRFVDEARKRGKQVCFPEFAPQKGGRFPVTIGDADFVNQVIVPGAKYAGDALRFFAWFHSVQLDEGGTDYTVGAHPAAVAALDAAL